MRASWLVVSLLLVSALRLSDGQFFGVGGGLLAAKALAGIGLLAGAAALGGLSRGFGSRRRTGGFGRGFRGRRHRSVSEPLQEEALWRAVAASDPSGCAQKLLCLLAAERHQLQGDERLLAELFGDLEDDTSVNLPSRLPYEAAHWVGNHRSASACEACYGAHCAYDRRQMMAAATRAWQRA